MQNDKRKVKIFIMIGILFGIYCFVFGQSGLLERIRLQNEKLELEKKIIILKKKNDYLNEKYKKYQNGNLIQSEAENSGYIYPGSKVIFFKSNSKNKSSFRKNRKQLNNDINIDIDHFRVIWVSISFFIVLFYIIILQRKKEIIQ